MIFVIAKAGNKLYCFSMFYNISFTSDQNETVNVRCSYDYSEQTFKIEAVSVQGVQIEDVKLWEANLPLVYIKEIEALFDEAVEMFSH